ncbi:MAG: hypothetical protein PW786_02035 [Arachidicoccus sp.]|nr:hypothetical protein [Arachidicoccus sp.]
MIAIFCLIIFTFQVIPVRVVGKLLSSGQITEDIAHGDQPIKQLTDDDFSKSFVGTQYYLLNPFQDHSVSDKYFITDDALIKCLHLEVLIQPPNS